MIKIKDKRSKDRTHLLLKALSITFIVAISTFLYPAFSFEWPENLTVSSDSFYSYFGQLRGGTISNSLVFSDPCKIKAWDDGFVTAVISEYDDDSIFFPSTLGNAVIIAHKEKILTVYANIERESLDSLNLGGDIKAGDPIGSSGNSAWQDGKSSLEFQVIDTDNNTIINPRTLIPHVGKELEMRPAGLVLQNKNGRNYKAADTDVLPAGIYRVYQKRPLSGMPYRTNLFVNGVIVDELGFNLIRQDDKAICISGKKNYTKSAVYPSDDLLLLGEVTVTTGKNSIRCTLFDMLGKESSINYNLTNY